MTMKTDGLDGKGQGNKCPKEVAKPGTGRSSAVLLRDKVSLDILDSDGNKAVAGPTVLSKEEKAANVLSEYRDCLEWHAFDLGKSYVPRGIVIKLKWSEQEISDAISTADKKDGGVWNDLQSILRVASECPSAAEFALFTPEIKSAIHRVLSESSPFSADDTVVCYRGDIVCGHALVTWTPDVMVKAIADADKKNPIVREALEEIVHIGVDLFPSIIVDAAKKALNNFIDEKAEAVAVLEDFVNKADMIPIPASYPLDSDLVISAIEKADKKGSYVGDILNIIVELEKLGLRSDIVNAAKKALEETK